METKNSPFGRTNCPCKITPHSRSIIRYVYNCSSTKEVMTEIKRGMGNQRRDNRSVGTWWFSAFSCTVQRAKSTKRYYHKEKSKYKHKIVEKNK